MKDITDPCINEAMNTIKTLSQDKQAYWDALTRERALRDEASELAAAEKRGVEQGLHTALTRLVASGIPEAQARSMLGLL